MIANVVHGDGGNDREMIDRLERLACGELDESARRPLLAWLEEDPRRWRMCSLALLEAQTWCAAIGHLHDGNGEVRLELIREMPGREPTPRSNVGRAAASAALAACLLAVFGLGWATRVVWHGEPSDGSSVARAKLLRASGAAHSMSDAPDGSANKVLLAEMAVGSQAGANPLTTIRVPVVPGDSGQSSAASHNNVSDYVRQQWERRGFKLSMERRYVFAKLPDGQRVVVPVDQVVANRIPSTIQ